MIVTLSKGTLSAAIILEKFAANQVNLTDEGTFP